jgi:hypothetical protein
METLFAVQVLKKTSDQNFAIGLNGQGKDGFQKDESNRSIEGRV